MKEICEITGNREIEIHFDSGDFESPIMIKTEGRVVACLCMDQDLQIEAGLKIAARLIEVIFGNGSATLTSSDVSSVRPAQIQKLNS
jgi:hypothetical protein